MQVFLYACKKLFNKYKGGKGILQYCILSIFLLFILSLVICFNKYKSAKWTFVFLLILAFFMLISYFLVKYNTFGVVFLIFLFCIIFIVLILMIVNLTTQELSLLIFKNRNQSNQFQENINTTIILIFVCVIFLLIIPHICTFLYFR